MDLKRLCALFYKWAVPLGTIVLAGATALLVIVTAILAVAGFFTWREMAQDVKLTRRMLEVSERQFEFGQRPRIRVEATGYNVDERLPLVNMSFSLKNVGKDEADCKVVITGSVDSELWGDVPEVNLSVAQKLAIPAGDAGSISGTLITAHTLQEEPDTYFFHVVCVYAWAGTGRQYYTHTVYWLHVGQLRKHQKRGTEDAGLHTGRLPQRAGTVTYDADDKPVYTPAE